MGVYHTSHTRQEEKKLSLLFRSQQRMISVKRYVLIAAMTAIVLVAMIEDCSGEPVTRDQLTEDRNYYGDPCDKRSLLEGVNGQDVDGLAENIAKCIQYLFNQIIR